MAEVVEDTKGKVRDLPVDSRLLGILRSASEHLPIGRVRVVSGGQCRKGSCSKRTGSTRHDLGMAADLQLWHEGRALHFNRSADLPTIEKFVFNCASLGATGFGAGEGYMPTDTIHVGYGKFAIWGKDGSGANAPAWLRQAVKDGWKDGGVAVAKSFIVAARPGLRLRAGPGVEFGVLSTIDRGEIITIQDFDGLDGQWARVDLEGDGFSDGHLMKSYLREVDLVDGEWVDPLDECSADASPTE